MVHIRPASTADAEAVALVRRDSWRAAYAGIVRAEIIERVTEPRDAVRERAMLAAMPWRRMLVAEAPAGPDGAARPAVGGDPAVAPVTAVVGYASYGPERDVDGTPGPFPGGQDSAGAPVAELYALYVTPDWWSTGTGRALMDRVLAELRAEGYPRIVLWVLTENARARRFYERCGFRLSGATHVLNGLGGVPEVCYERALAAA
ncbi:MAG TPA: GNAT family N-acetyltransferase [Streptosporangiaceae bacterium]